MHCFLCCFVGVEGGFDVDAGRKKYDYEDVNSIVILPEFSVINLPDDSLPAEVPAFFSRVTPSGIFSNYEYVFV